MNFSLMVFFLPDTWVKFRTEQRKFIRIDFLFLNSGGTEIGKNVCSYREFSQKTWIKFQIQKFFTPILPFVFEHMITLKNFCWCLWDTKSYPKNKSLKWKKLKFRYNWYVTF